MESETDYRLLIDHLEKLTDRRQNITTIYLSVNATILGAISFLFKNSSIIGRPQQISVLMLLVAGIISSDIWRRLLGEYEILLGWWYQQVRELETVLPESRQFISHEYKELYLNGNKNRPVGLTRHEVKLTWLFMVFYLGFGITILFFV